MSSAGGVPVAGIAGGADGRAWVAAGPGAAAGIAVDVAAGAGAAAGTAGGVAAVIVVAGGRSTRFGGDKLRHRIRGRTLLERTVDAAAVAGPVVLVGAADPPPGVAVAVSERPRWGGPCAALAAAVDAVDGDGDLLLLAADLADPSAAVAALGEAGVLTDTGGHPQWLLARIPAALLRERVAALRARGPLDGLPAATLLRDAAPLRAAPGAAIADIDTRADLSPDPPLPAPSPPSSPQRMHGLSAKTRSLCGLDGGGRREREELVDGTV